MRIRGIHNSIIEAAGITLRLCLLLLGLSIHIVAQAQLNTSQAIETGRQAMFFDDYRTAIHYFTLAVEAKPYLAEGYYNRGLAYFHLGDFMTAEDDLSRAIMFNPFHVEYYELRGLCRIHTEKYAAAASDYTNVIAEAPEHQTAYFNRALCRFELHDYATANLDLDFIISHWPRFARAYVVKAQVCLELADTLQGLYWIDSLLTISKREPNAWSVKGRHALKQKAYNLADSCYTQALRYDAGNVNYYLHRGNARFCNGHISMALSDFERVLTIEPENNLAQHNCSAIRHLIETRGKILPELLDVEDEENHSFMKEFMGKVEGRANERVFLPPYRVDGTHLYVAGGRHPIYSDDESFLRMLQFTDVEAGVPLTTALAKIRSYVAASPDDALLLYNLGCLEVEGGTLEDAEKAFDKAILLDPLLAEAYYNKAVVHLLRNEHNVARPLLLKAGDMGIVKAYAVLHQIEAKE